MKESYIKLPNITVSKLQDVIDYLDENNIEYIEEYKRDEEIDRLNNIINELEKWLNEKTELMKSYSIERMVAYNASLDKLDELKGDNK